MRLYDDQHRRLYLNASERERFARMAACASPMASSFGLTLLYTGCRISEALALRRSSVQAECNVLTFRTLKRRRHNIYREVPVPDTLIKALNKTHRLHHSQSDKQLWTRGGEPINRVTAYRWIKGLMDEAEISGAQACPKGLRHGYGIHALRSGVQLNMLQKWMGHADMSTTAIYADACGAEEREIAGRMWL